jgi:serine/threonine protein kinase
VTEKNDVYSFGVVLLELLSGRRALVSEQFDLVQWACSIIKGPPPILDKILDLSIKVSRGRPEWCQLSYKADATNQELVCDICQREYRSMWSRVAILPWLPCVQKYA